MPIAQEALRMDDQLTVPAFGDDRLHRSAASRFNVQLGATTAMRIGNDYVGRGQMDKRPA